MNMIKKIKFKNWADMYRLITSGTDLYNPKTGCYVFVYNDVGALCYYKLRIDEVLDLICQSKKDGEYWGAYLGTGGYVLDDMNYKNGFKKYLQPSFDFCKDNYTGEWVKTSDEKLSDYLVEKLWEEFEDVLFVEDTNKSLLLSSNWFIFEAGTLRDEIWHWFNENHSKKLSWLMNEYEPKEEN